MPRRYFNWKLAVVLLIGLVVLGVTAYGLRQWHRGRRAEHGLEAGNKAYQEHNWPEAARNFGRYLAVNHDDVDVLFKYAQAQLNIRPVRRNNIQQAVAAYRSVLRLDRDNRAAVVQLAGLYLQMAMPGEAELIVQRQLQNEPGTGDDQEPAARTSQDPELRRILAIALARQRKFTEAAEELRSIIADCSDHVPAYESLGQLVEHQPEHFSDEPEHWFDEAVKNNPSSALAYIVRGAYHLRKKQTAEGLADLEHAEELDLSDPATRLRLAVEFVNAQAFDKAENQLKAVRELEPANQMLWRTWAQLALKSQSPEQMRQVAEDGLKELSSQPWDFIQAAAELFIRAGQFSRSAECISLMREKEIAPVATAFLEGLLAERQGNLLEAVRCWRRTTELGDKSPRVRLALASALSRWGDRQSALRQLQVLVSEEPAFLDGHLALARLLAQTGNWSEATNQARAAARISPNRLDAVLLYVQARMELLARNQTDANSPMWSEIEQQLHRLDDATGGAVEVKLSQFQLAMQRHDFAGAEALLAELKKSAPSEVKIALAQVELLTAREKNDEAISVLRKTIGEFPEAIGPVQNLAILLAGQGNHQECEAAIKEAMARIDQPVVRRQLGLLLTQFYLSRQEHEKMYDFLSGLALEMPNDIPVKRQLLRCERVLNNSAEAQQLVDDIKSVEGEHGWQWRYEQARLWFPGDDFKTHYSQVISLLGQNLLENPDDQACRRLLAATYDKAGELQLAISTYREALSRSPDDLSVIIPAAAALYKAEEYEQADEILRRASQLKLNHPQLRKLQFRSYLRRGQLGLASDILEDFVIKDPNNRNLLLSLALLKMQQQELDEAGELLAKLTEQEPNSLAVASGRIRLNIERDRPEEALRICSEMVANLGNVSAYILRARTLASLGQIDKAVQDLEHAGSLEPDNVNVWAASSDFYHGIGRPAKARDSIEQALLVAPDNIEVQKRSILLFLQSGNAELARRARDILDKALQSNPADTQLRMFKARLLVAEGTAPATEEAALVLKKIVEEHPMNNQAWVLLGQISLKQGQAGKAADAALRGLANKPDDKGLLLLKARAEAERSPVLAIPTLKALRELYPDDVDVLLLLAEVYISADECGKAVELLSGQLDARKGTPDERRIAIELAVALYKNGSKAEAGERFDSLSRLAADDPAPLLAQVRVLKDDRLWSRLSERVEKWCHNHPQDTQTPITVADSIAVVNEDEARKTAEKLLGGVLARKPDYLPAMNRLATVFQVMGRSAEASTLYRRILVLQPDNIVAMNNLAWILCNEQGNYQEALELAQRGLQKAPNYADLIDTRGVIYFQLGDYDRAVQDFSRCLELYPDNFPAVAASHLHLGKALAKLGQRDRAIESLQNALAANSKVDTLSPAEIAEAQRMVKELREEQ